jgi:hypothetical protein
MTGMTRASTASLLPLLLAACGADDATPVTYRATYENVSTPDALVAADGSGTADIFLAPGVWAVHPPDVAPIFEVGAAAGEALERLAEDGANAELVAALERDARVTAHGTLAVLNMETYEESPIGPGVSVTVELVAEPGMAFSFAAMFAQSNDLFVGSVPTGVVLDADVDVDVYLWDAGTEVNEEPGFGGTQAPRQSAPDEGADEGGVVTEVVGTDAAGFTYPAPSAVAAVRVARVDS